MFKFPYFSNEMVGGGVKRYITYYQKKTDSSYLSGHWLDCYATLFKPIKILDLYWDIVRLFLLLFQEAVKKENR